MRRGAVFAVSVLFFLSGATALSAEVVLNKLLTYVFGSSHLSTSTVLAAYMAGLSAGAWLFGRRARGSLRPVRAYAWLELSVGAFYALLPLVFGPFQRLAISLAAPLAGSPAVLTLVRFGLSFALVFAPTLMMGGTLPTLVSAFQPGQALRRSLPLLYAVNTLGAALGTLVSSYLAIPALGLDGALYACAGLNFAIAAGSLWLEPRLGKTPTTGEDVAPDAPAPASSFSLSARAALVFAFAQGAIAFVLEVVWFHLIGTVIGVTTYAFALMLFSILLGVGLGSLLLPPMLRRTRRAPLGIFIGAMLFVALSVGASRSGWDRFSTVVEAFPELHTGGHFWAREAVRLGFCLVMLLPTTLALGMSLPALAASVRSPSADGRHGAWVGRLFASNTLGTIAGSIGCGFFLLGRLGSERILQLGAALAILLSVLAFALGTPEKAGAPRASRLERGVLAAALLAAIGLVLAPGGWDLYRLTLGNHYYWAPQEAPFASRVGWLREDAQSGFITVMQSPDGQKTLRTNGKYEGNNDVGEFQDLFALLGGLYVKHYERAVMVGLGPARTLSVLHAMPFRHIEAVEYSPAIIAAAKEEFPEFSAKALADTARVSLFCDDGRNHVQLSAGGYDYVAIAISGAAFAGVGNIYSREFFQNVSGKLADGGIFMLWIQVHHVFPRDVRSVVFTLRSVFPHVHFYTDPTQSQGFLMASRSALDVDPEKVRALDASPRVLDALTHHGMDSALELVLRSVFTTNEELDRYLAAPDLGAAPVLLTDLAPAFEYSTPYSLAEPLGSFDFQRFSDKRLPIFSPPLSLDEQEELEARRALVGGQ